jgi:hypothetical protein
MEQYRPVKITGKPLPLEKEDRRRILKTGCVVWPVVAIPRMQIPV